MAQYLTPEGWYVSDDDANQYMLPSGEYLNGTGGGVTVRALVLDAGYLEQYTSGGARLRLSSGRLSTTAGGTAVVWDAATKTLREAAGGETVLQP